MAMSTDDTVKIEYEVIHFYGRTRTSQDFIPKGCEVDMGGFIGNGSYRSHVSESLCHSQQAFSFWALCSPPMCCDYLQCHSAPCSYLFPPPRFIPRWLILFPESRKHLPHNPALRTAQNIQPEVPHKCVKHTQMKGNCFLGSVAGNFQTNFWSLTS